MSRYLFGSCRGNVDNDTSDIVMPAEYGCLPACDAKFSLFPHMKFITIPNVLIEYKQKKVHILYKDIHSVGTTEIFS